mmetsp:Transcript_13533/g.31814  ORF Transcript_13533/g.31814 Transcript_13533/m.31814 type:complete len:284 (-) Transcript_13533:646-1497(-)
MESQPDGDRDFLRHLDRRLRARQHRFAVVPERRDAAILPARLRVEAEASIGGGPGRRRKLPRERRQERQLRGEEPLPVHRRRERSRAPLGSEKEDPGAAFSARQTTAAVDDERRLPKRRRWRSFLPVQPGVAGSHSHVHPELVAVGAVPVQPARGAAGRNVHPPDDRRRNRHRRRAFHDLFHLRPGTESLRHRNRRRADIRSRHQQRSEPAAVTIAALGDDAATQRGCHGIGILTGAQRRLLQLRKGRRDFSARHLERNEPQDRWRVGEQQLAHPVHERARER